MPTFNEESDLAICGKLVFRSPIFHHVNEILIKHTIFDPEQKSSLIFQEIVSIIVSLTVWTLWAFSSLPPILQNILSSIHALSSRLEEKNIYY